MLGGFRPDERLGSWVPSVDEVPNLAREVFDTVEGSAVDGLSFDDSEPHFGEVHPGCRGRGEMDVDAGVRRQPVAKLLLVVGGVVVHHEMQL